MPTFRTCALLTSLAVLSATVCSSQLSGRPSEPAADEIPGALPLTAADPADNPRTPAKIALGKALFYDPILSGNKDVSCATCHHPKFGFTDGRDLPVGVGGEGQGRRRHFRVRGGGGITWTKRNAPTLLNVAFNGIDARGQYAPATAPMFYDLRARSLEAQSLLPIATFEEMRGPRFTEANALDSVVARLRAIPRYYAAFQAVFGGTVPVTVPNLGKALAAFERTLLANNAPFDRYRRGDATALTAAQQRGLALFVSNGCTGCHRGPMFSDYQTHVLGVEDNSKLSGSDRGQNGTYAFRTPTLRNVALTAPYMHSGRQPSLAAAVGFYRGITRGRQLNANVRVHQLDSLLRPNLTGKNDLVAFLHALTDEGFDNSVPATVPSGLVVGGR